MALMPLGPPVCPFSFQVWSREREGRARVPETGFHGTGQEKDPLKGGEETAGYEGSKTPPHTPHDAAESATTAGCRGRGQVVRRVPPGEPPRPPQGAQWGPKPERTLPALLTGPPAPTARRRRLGAGSSCRWALSAESTSEGASEAPAPTQFREPPPPPLLLLAKWREGWRRAGAETPEN